jgi:hypothetical protein
MNAERRALRDQIRDFNNLASITTPLGTKVPFPAARDDLPWGTAMLIYTPVVATPAGREPVRPYAANGAHFIAFTHTGELHVLRDPGAALLKSKQSKSPAQFVRLAANLLFYKPDAASESGLNYRITPMSGTTLWATEEQMFDLPPIQSAIRAQIDRFTENGTIALLVHQGGIAGPATRGFFPLILMNPSTLYFTTAHLSVEHYYEYWRVYYEFLFDLPEAQRSVYEFLTLPPPSQIERKPPSGRVAAHTKTLQLDGARTIQRRAAVSEDAVQRIDLLHWGGGTYSVKFFNMSSQPIGRTEGEALRDVLESPGMAARFESFPAAVIPRANSTFPGFDVESYLKSSGVGMWKRPRSNAAIRK